MAEAKEGSQAAERPPDWTWNLTSFEEGSGESNGHLGRDAIGQIVYDAAGNMAVQIMKAHRPLFASGDQGVGTSEEMSAALGGYVAYCGTYSVDETARVVTHSLTMSLFSELGRHRAAPARRLQRRPVDPQYASDVVPRPDAPLPRRMETRAAMTSSPRVAQLVDAPLKSVMVANYSLRGI